MSDPAAPAVTHEPDAEAAAAAFRTTVAAIERRSARLIVGQAAAVRGTLICLVLGGHALLEGVPGTRQDQHGARVRPARSGSRTAESSSHPT